MKRPVRLIPGVDLRVNNVCGSDFALDQAVDVPREGAERLVVADEAMDVDHQELTPAVLQVRWGKRLGRFASRV